MTCPPPSRNERDLDVLGCGIIPALLIPLSDCAILSSELPSNKKKSTTIPVSSLTKLDLPDKIKSGKDLDLLALKLEPSMDISYYSLGSSFNSYIVLQSVDEDEAYVNFLHCQFIPYPDRNSVVLYNASTSAFKVQNLDTQSPVRTVLPTNKETFDHGNWHLELGKGLEFLLRVLPRDPEIYTGFLVPCEAVSEGREEVNKTIPSLRHRIEKIGETDITQVLRVQRKGKIVAAKVCRKPDIKWAADTWLNEMQILKDLKHHSVVQMLDFDGRHLTIFLEYIEGVDLSKMVDRDFICRIPKPDQYRIWNDISSALEYIHRLNILHHDIKPHNIILGKGNRGAVLCDFGIATLGPRFQNGGTPCYISPEFIYGQRDKPSDIWAFGVTMLFVNGLLPLPSGKWRIAEVERDIHTLAQMVDWLDQIKALRACLPKHLALLRGMLTEDANRRITASDLARDLVALTKYKTRERLRLLTGGQVQV
ncbi:hypothetical protein EMCG_06092 [[Emmonsia] crescens]|uniref:Serine/threonine-protein kinase ATG1 n=1 Tax=[Emmonsia] crescens TaxID=73230 RepID=A0A0G2JBX3_9EURO|nr:hypothetical protein EMCG_06092 [Emmonsia crescens UAMH 3008]